MEGRISTGTKEFAESVRDGQTSVPGSSRDSLPNSPTVSNDPLPPLPSTEDAISRFTSLNVALDKAVNLARQQRQDSTLDMLGGVIPTGALPASSFAGIVSAFNQASSPASGALVSGALGFGQDTIQREFDTAQQARAIALDETNQIRDFGLSLIGQGLKEETMSAILAAPTIESAIATANAALNSKSKTNESFEIREVTRPGGGEVLVKINSDGTEEVLYEAQRAPEPQSSFPTSTSPTTNQPAGFIRPTNKEISLLKQALNASKFQGPEADGRYADPSLYLINYQNWLDAGGTAEDFFEEFPPKTYINPANTWLPEEIMRFVNKPSSSQNNLLAPF